MVSSSADLDCRSSITVTFVFSRSQPQASASRFARSAGGGTLRHSRLFLCLHFRWMFLVGAGSTSASLGGSGFFVMTSRVFSTFLSHQSTRRAQASEPELTCRDSTSIAPPVPEPSPAPAATNSLAKGSLTRSTNAASTCIIADRATPCLRSFRLSSSARAASVSS